MPIEIRTPEDVDVAALFAADARGFGFTYDQEEIDRRRPVLDLTRYRVVLDASSIVGVAGSFAMDMSLPGGASIPVGGVTWVSVAATHRRQGLLRRLLAAIHTDIDDRDEPLAVLGASEGGIYGRFGYGVAALMRRVSIEKRAAQFRDDVHLTPGSVRFMEPDEAKSHVPAMWERVRRNRSGEMARDTTWWEMVFADQAKEEGGFAPAFRLRHDDGYATFQIKHDWNEGQPGHQLSVVEFMAATDEAHAALWHTILGVDLVGTVTSRRAVAVDDALPYLLTDPRTVRTVGLDDNLWVRPQRPAALLGARTYGSEDRLTVELLPDEDAPAAVRYEVEGGSDGASAKRVRRRPDLVLNRAGLGAISLGGVRPSVLARAGLITEATPGALRRADTFFSTDRAPHSQHRF